MKQKKIDPKYKFIDIDNIAVSFNLDSVKYIFKSNMIGAEIFIDLTNKVIDLTPLEYNIGPFKLYSLVKSIWKNSKEIIKYSFPIMMVGIIPNGTIKYEMLSGWTIKDPNSKLVKPVYKLPRGINYNDL
jgi:hypothetical protein